MIFKLNFLNFIFQLLQKLSKKRRFQLVIGVVLLFFSGLLETFNVASLIPLMTAIVNKESIFEIKLLDSFFSYLSISNANTALILVSLIFLAFTIFSALLKIFNCWYSNKLSIAIGSDLAFNAYKLILYQPYEKL